MKTLPTNTQEWLNLLALPFKTFVSLFVIIFFLYFAPYPFPQFRPWADAYFYTFLALIVIAGAQTVTKHFRDAMWSSLFAILALCIVLGFVFFPKSR